MSRTGRHPSSLSPVLVGVHGGPDEQRVLDAAIEIAQRRSAPLIVVHVVATTPSAAVAVPSAAGAVALTGEELADRCHLDCEIALAGTDPAVFRSAIIWCKQFSHLFATAAFADAPA